MFSAIVYKTLIIGCHDDRHKSEIVLFRFMTDRFQIKGGGEQGVDSNDSSRIIEL